MKIAMEKTLAIPEFLFCAEREGNCVGNFKARYFNNKSVIEVSTCQRLPFQDKYFLNEMKRREIPKLN